MPWWAWIVLGIGLLGVELLIIDAQFYLVFVGLAAAVVGLLGLFGLGLPEWAEWLVFAVLAVVAMLGFRRRIYESVRGRGVRSCHSGASTVPSQVHASVRGMPASVPPWITNLPSRGSNQMV